MDNLRKYWGKSVRLLDVDDDEWIGFVEGYTDSNNNPEEEESIDIRVDNSLIVFFPDEIKSIEILDQPSS